MSVGNGTLGTVTVEAGTVESVLSVAAVTVASDTTLGTVAVFSGKVSKGTLGTVTVVSGTVWDGT